MDNAGTQTATLTGTGVSVPLAVLTPATYDFGQQVSGTTTKPQVFTLSNPGTFFLSIYSVNIGGANASQFSAISSCPAILDAGASCQISVTFSPTNSASASASLIVVDSVGTQTSSLSGSGGAQPPDFTFTMNPPVRSTDDGRGTFVFTLSFSQAYTPTPITSPVTLAYSGFPDGTIYTLTPNPTILLGSVPVSATLTVQIPGQASRLNRQSPFPHKDDTPLYAFAVFGIVSAFALRRRTRGNRRLSPLLSLLAVLSFMPMFTLIGCNFHLPNGEATLTVTATSGTFVHSASANCFTDEK
jgi:hypothetical protein